LVDRLCGQQARVPVTTGATIEVDGESLEGAVQFFLDDAAGFAEDFSMGKDLAQAVKVSQADAEALALLDLRVFNTDRHGGNLLLLGSIWPKTLGPIDHGCCLPPWWALGEARFEAWMDWPQLSDRPSDAARTLAAEARRQLVRSCELLRELRLDVASIATLQICTCLVAVGVADLGLPLAKLAQLMVREDYSEFSWLEERVLASATQEGAKVTVGRNKYNDKLFVLEDCGTADESVFVDKLVARLENVFREQLVGACAVEADDDDDEGVVLHRTSATWVTLPHPAMSTALSSVASSA